MFQSLIGELKTPDALFLPTLTFMFQSLIGELKTFRERISCFY